MPTARILIWALTLFLGCGAFYFLVRGCAIVGRAWRTRRVVRRERMALGFDPVRSVPRAKVLPEAKAFFASKRLGNSEPGRLGDRTNP